MLTAALSRGPDRFRRCLCAVLLLLSGALSQAQPAADSTRTIVDFIEELRGRGIDVIYGSDLVPDTLLMTTEAGADRGLGSLEAALRPHGLTLRPGPRQTWLIVRAPESAADAAAPADAAPAAARPVFVAPPLETVVVSASRYAFTRATGPSTTELDRTELLDAPTFGSDAVRATHNLPGMASSGLTARVNVRGGDTDESLLYLDGVRLYNPFHMKDFQGLFSSINPQIVESMSVYTGAYPAEFGDRMSAVIDVEPFVPGRDRQFEVGVSTLATSLFGAGRFAAGRGSYVASVRRGNLDLLIDAAKTDAGTPRYADAFARLEYEVRPALGAYGGVLVLNDKIVLNDVGIGTARADYKDSYIWGGVERSGTPFDFDLLVASTDLSGVRSGQVDDPVGSLGSLNDSRDFRSLSVGFDWTWTIHDSHWLRGGVQLRDSEAGYVYSSQRIDRVPILTPGLQRPPATSADTVMLDRNSRAYFLTYRARVGDAVTTEIGLRRDEQSLPDDSQLSPRINVLYDVTDRLSLRGSWGRYHQADSLYELQIGDGVTSLFPAQESEHTVIGLEYMAGASISLRIEAYRKEFERLRPRFENLFGRVSLLPELQPDRVMIAPLRGDASGVELSVEGGEGVWSWWFNLARARTNDVLAGIEVDRSWEEPWALKGGFLWIGPGWTVSLASSWHTGWPISRLMLAAGQLVAGPPNTDRLEHFSSVNVRASRSKQLRRGELEWFVELNNAFDSANPCCVEYDVTLDAQSLPDSLYVFTDNWLPVVPTIGFNWRTGSD